MINRRAPLMLVGLTFVLSAACAPAPELSADGTATIEEAGPRRVTTDVVYGHKDGLALTFDVYHPITPNGAAVISVISGGWRSSWETLQQFDMTPAGEARLLTAGDIDARGGILPSHSYLSLLDKGFTVFAVRHGSSPRFSLTEIVADMRRAVRFVRHHAADYGVSPDRIGIWGGSAGGHLSLLLGTTAEVSNPDAEEAFERESGSVAAVVAYAPPTDFSRWATAERRRTFVAVDLDGELLHDLSPINFATSDDAPALIVHGDEDATVPHVEGASMFEALEDAGVESRLLTIEGADHGFFGADAARANAAMVEWFETHLR